MNLTEKMAYINGLTEGLSPDLTTPEGKVLKAVLELLEDLTDVVSVLESDVEQIFEELDAVDEDLTDLEDAIYDEDCDCDDCKDDELFEGGIYEITCSNCGEVVCVDEEMLEEDEISCPACGTKFEIDFEDEE